MEHLPEELSSAIILQGLCPYRRHGQWCLPRAQDGLRRRLVCRTWKRIVDGHALFWGRVVLHYEPNITTALEALIKILAQRRDDFAAQLAETNLHLFKYRARAKRQRK
jgi:hypothetical protein